MPLKTDKMPTMNWKVEDKLLTWKKCKYQSSYWPIKFLIKYTINNAGITSSLDFDKGGCLIQIEWTKSTL